VEALGNCPVCPLLNPALRILLPRINKNKIKTEIPERMEPNE